MRNLTIYVALTLLCIAAFTGQSADIPKPVVNPKFSVEISVSCEDDNTKAFIESHIKRELRSLQDVEIVDTGKYKLSIVTVEPEYKTSGRKTGKIAAAYQFQRRYNPAIVINMLTKAYPGKEYQKQRGDIALELLFLHDKETFGLITDDTDDLDGICKSIVVKFDTQVLEPDRNGK